MANIEFKNITEYKKYLRTQHLTYLGEGSEAKCYVSNVDNLVYKNLLEETYIRNSYSADELITKKQVNLPSFAFPIDLHTYQNTVWGYTSEFIFPDQFSEKSTVSRTKFLKINFNRLRKALELLKKDTEKISKENILIDDLPFNLIFTGTRLIAIDTLSYVRVEKNTLEDNTKRLEYALQTMFDFWLQNLKITVEEEPDIDKYLKNVEEIQRQLKK